MPELEKYLKDGEKLLWTGKPEFGETLDRVYKPELIRRSVIALAVCVVLEVLYAVAVHKIEAAEYNWIVAAVVAVVCVLTPLALPLRTRKLRKCRYGATDQRLLLLNGDKATAMEYDRIKTAALRRDGVGNVTLLCGKSAVKSRAGKWRELTLFSESRNPEGEDCDSFVMYAVSGGAKLREVLRGRLTCADET